MRIRHLLISTVVSALFAVGAQAATLWTNTGTGDWGTGTNWDSGEPDQNDVATIDNGGTAQVTQNGERADGLIIDNDSTVEQTGGSLTTYEGGFEIKGGGAYELSGGDLLDNDTSPSLDVFVGFESSGSFIQTGGTFGVVNPRSISGGHDDFVVGRNSGGDGLFRISGGSFYLNHDNSDFSVGESNDGAVGQFEVSGSNIDTIQIGRALRLRSNASTVFELDDGGVTPVRVGTREENTNQGNAAVQLAGSLGILLLDEPPLSDITLIDFDDPLGDDADAPVTGTFDGLAEGDDVSALYGGLEYVWDITYQGNGSVSGGGNDVMLTDLRVIPEPTTVALFGLGAVTMLLGRKRRA